MLGGEKIKEPEISINNTFPLSSLGFAPLDGYSFKTHTLSTMPLQGRAPNCQKGIPLLKGTTHIFMLLLRCEELIRYSI